MRKKLDPGLELATRTIITDRAHIDRWKSLLRPLGWRPYFRGWKIMPQQAENPTGRTLVQGLGVCAFVEANDKLYVDVDGTIVPCCVHPRAGEFGNLLHAKWSDIIVDGAREAFASELQERRDKLPICAQ